MHLAENIDLVSGTIGGVIIGLASTSFLIVTGKLTGISGIVENFLVPNDDEKNAWSLSYLAGLIAAGYTVHAANSDNVSDQTASLTVAVAGVIVGIGTRMGSGCTSGHGICGLPRLSLRSLVAVGSFMTTGAIAAYGKRMLDEKNALPLLNMDILHMTQSHGHISYYVPTVVAFCSVYAVLSLRMGKSPERSGSARHPSTRLIEHIAAFCSAFLFGVGLSISGMCNSDRVVGFLDFTGPRGWDPSLIGVMGGGVLFNLLSFQVLHSLNIKAVTCELPKEHEKAVTMKNALKIGGHSDNTLITDKLVVGSAIFGVGWGLGGICPGPAFVSLGASSTVAAVFVPSLLLGVGIHELIKRVRPSTPAVDKKN